MAMRLLAAVLGTLVLAGPGSASVVAYLCSMSGERVTECCCKPSKQHAQHVPSEDRVARAGCCALEIIDGVRVPGTIERAHQVESPTLAVVAVLSESPELWAQRPVPAAAARAPPAHAGPPLHVRHCRFLI